MGATRLAVLGAGSVRCSPAVIAALANYFGERPIEICLFDADEERLDLFAGFARVCCTVTRSYHHVYSTTDLDEALTDVDLAIVQVGENCAHKFLRFHPELLGGIALDQMDRAQAVRIAAEAMVPEWMIRQGRALSLIKASSPEALPLCDSIDQWPPVTPFKDRYKVPHQVLRWVRSEEHPGEWLIAHEHTPLRAWLDEAIAAITQRLD
jgi:hypothetical protein